VTAATKIVIVAGQEFSVPSETDNEAIRSQLAGMGFADVASATIQKGKRKIGEEQCETIEFVKKAGTKGMDGAELAALLASVPRASAPKRPETGPSYQQTALLRRLLAGELPIGEALAHTDLPAALTACHHVTWSKSTEGDQLCNRLDLLLPVAAPGTPRGW
jgi:hypothetical protein